MTSRRLTVARIGNSRGVRIPATTLARYRIGDAVMMEEREDGILLRPVRTPERKLSFEDTARAMAAEAEDWSDLESSVGDGVELLPWEYPAPQRPPVRRAAESSPAYSAEPPELPRRPTKTVLAKRTGAPSTRARK
jgi:antitoxin component of MazEF toxin-antitoxin module